MDFDAVPASLRERLGSRGVPGPSQSPRSRTQRMEGGLDRRVHKNATNDASRRKWPACACRWRKWRRRFEPRSPRWPPASARIWAQMGARIRRIRDGEHPQDTAKWALESGTTWPPGASSCIKWCFIFWIGQVLAMTGITGVMLRLFRP